jgi:hypothetical protein
LWGLAYYPLVAVLAFFDSAAPLYIVAWAGVLISLYLAYLLYVKLRLFCILCTSIYVINFLILLLLLFVY